MSAGPGPSVTRRRSHLAWSLVATMLALIAPLSGYPALMSSRYWLFGYEYASILLPPVLIGVAAVACALQGLQAAQRNKKGKVLAAIAIVISGLALTYGVGIFLIEMGAGG
jgi:hypothetical protein